MQINSISMANYANLSSRAVSKTNLKSNVNFEGKIILDDRAKKWCGMGNVENYVREWERELPDDTTMDIYWTGESDGFYCDIFGVNVYTPTVDRYYRDIDLVLQGIEGEVSIWDFDIGYRNRLRNLKTISECVSAYAGERKAEQ